MTHGPVVAASRLGSPEVYGLMTRTGRSEDGRMGGERHGVCIPPKRPIFLHGYVQYTWILSSPYWRGKGHTRFCSDPEGKHPWVMQPAPASPYHLQV
jgi:hypothetical protein